MIEEEHEAGIEYQTDAQLLDYARKPATTIYYPLDNCEMGRDEIVLADSSIMPAVVSGNINAPAIMIAEKAAYMTIEYA